jgi:hypothetical protein
MPRARRAPPEKNLRALGLIHEAEQFADGLRLIALGFAVMEMKQGGGVTACANEISKRLDALRTMLRSSQH